MASCWLAGWEEQSLYEGTNPTLIFEDRKLTEQQTWYGGRFSNYNLPHILKESPLIETFRKMHINIEENFYLENRTIRHAPPKMTKTLLVLQEHIAKKKSHTFTAGRKVTYPLPDRLREGLATAEKELDEDVKLVLASYEDGADTLVEADDLIED